MEDFRHLLSNYTYSIHKTYCHKQHFSISKLKYNGNKIKMSCKDIKEVVLNIWYNFMNMNMYWPLASPL